MRTGSRDEHAEEAGVSHFLEHMMFKGTPTRTAAEVNLAFDRIGASDHTNAATGEETTEYYTAVLPEYLPDAVDILADMLRPSFLEEDFATEKQVILEEIKMYEDSPRGRWRGTTPRRPTTPGTRWGTRSWATTESITALTSKQMRDYFARRYVGPNVLAVAAGNYDWDEFVRLIEECCGGWPGTPAARESLTEAAGAGGVHLIPRPDASQEHVLVMAPGPASDSPLRYPAMVLSLALGDYTGSRIYWELVDPGRVESAGFLADFNHGAGLVAATFSCDPDQTQANLDTIRAILAKAQAEGVTEDELATAKNKITSRIVRYAEKPTGRMRAIAGAWLAVKEQADVDRELARYDAVSRDGVREYLDKYPLTAHTVVGYGPVTELS